MEFYSQLEVAFWENVVGDPGSQLADGRFWLNITDNEPKIRVNGANTLVNTEQKTVVTNAANFAALPANDSGRLGFTTDQNKLYVNNGTSWIAVGSAAGGGGGANWRGDALEDEEFSEKVWKYEQSGGQTLTLYVKVPQGYSAGDQIRLFLAFYSPSTANQFRMDVTTSLVREANDAIDSSTNQSTANTGDITNTVANQYRQGSFDLTDASGEVNSVAVSAGDLLRVELTRGTPGGSEDSADIRFVPSSTEVTFS